MLKQRNISEYDAYFFDLDGCIYCSNKLNTGSVELVNRLKEDRKKVCFITNNSTETAGEIAKKLAGMGLQTEQEHIFTATDYVGKYIKDKFGSVIVKTVGSKSLQISLQKYGHTVAAIHDNARADMVVIGRDIQFNYEKLQHIIREAENGAYIMSTNPDFSHPGPGGKKIPETGALTAAVEVVLGEKVMSFGKPMPFLFHYGIKDIGASPRDCLMIGDNLNTDIAGGNQAGMSTVWLNENYEYHSRDKHKPNYMVQSIQHLYCLYVEKAAATCE